VERESTRGPNWLDLPIDLTANILQRLGTFEIVTSACRVCPLWWNICKDPLMWRSISMRYVCDSLFDDFDSLFDACDDGNIVKICCKAVERSCDHFDSISWHSSMSLSWIEWQFEEKVHWSDQWFATASSLLWWLYMDGHWSFSGIGLWSFRFIGFWSLMILRCQWCLF